MDAGEGLRVRFGGVFDYDVGFVCHLLLLCIYIYIYACMYV